MNHCNAPHEPNSGSEQPSPEDTYITNPIDDNTRQLWYAALDAIDFEKLGFTVKPISGIVRSSTKQD